MDKLSIELAGAGVNRFWVGRQGTDGVSIYSARYITPAGAKRGAVRYCKKHNWQPVFEDGD